MINFHIISLFPKAFESYLDSSIIKRGRDKGAIKIYFRNPRDLAKDKHQTVDDRPYGGGPGMVMKAEPVLKAAESIFKKYGERKKIIIFSPRGKQFSQKMADSWAKKCKNIIMICGHYEGVDERIRKILKADLISIGPYILTGGELPAMTVIDAVSRHVKGVLGKKESLEEKRGEAGAPAYTRPETIIWKGKKYKTPKVLLSGNPKKINLWKRRNIYKAKQSYII